MAILHSHAQVNRIQSTAAFMINTSLVCSKMLSIYTAFIQFGCYEYYIWPH